MIYTASRLSNGNVAFPDKIFIDDCGVTIRRSDILSHDDIYLPFEEISSIVIDAQILGFSTIVFYARGSSITAHKASFAVHGFSRRDAESIKREVFSHKY